MTDERKPHPDDDRSHRKRLDEMDSLLDVGRFPPLVYAGAVANVLATVWAIFRFRGRLGDAPFDLAKLVALVLSANLSPVISLRALGDMNAPKPVVEEMDFVRDQHRFPPWVYAAASANMALWVSAAWLASRKKRDGRLPLVLVSSLIGTLAPRILFGITNRRP